MPTRRIPNDPAQQAKKKAQKITDPDDLIGPVRITKLTHEQREKIARKGPVKRWAKDAPKDAPEDNSKI